MKYVLFLGLVHCSTLQAQLKWVNANADFQPLPASIQVFKTTDNIDGKPNLAYYVRVSLKDRSLQVTTDTGNGRRFTPSQYYDKNGHPFLVMNTTFFEFVHNSNLNVVIGDGRLRAYQQHSLAGRGKDTFTYRHPFGSAIGISKKRKPDIAWLYTDSTLRFAYASQQPVPFFKDSIAQHSTRTMLQKAAFRKWKMQTAVGGGPVLIQNGNILITNNEEIKFAGKAINDKHPRSAMGYTSDGSLIFLVIEGRFPGKAEGATLTEAAAILKDIGCVEALNLDGGGSSCLLINGKQTITPSDKGIQRPVPAVIMIK